jgi:hypothetical protein
VSQIPAKWRSLADTVAELHEAVGSGDPPIDLRRAVLTLLRDEEWGQWSDREIARRCAVYHPFVGSIRASLVSETSERPLTCSETSEPASNQ